MNLMKIQKYEPYVIAIPSYKRATMIYKKTLATLAQHLGPTPPVLIYVFLANQDELIEYQSAWPQDFQLQNQAIQFVIGDKGLKNQRNYIMDYFPAYTNIVQMDDDLDDALKPIVDLHQFYLDAFQKCRLVGSNIWGIYPVPNAYFMTPTQTTDLRFIVGPMFGVINRHDAGLRLTTNEKENVERTLKYFTLDGHVLRYNNITVRTRYFRTMGGMQASTRTSARRANALRSAEYLHRLYPDLTRIHLDKKSGWPEIKFLPANNINNNRNNRKNESGKNKTVKHIRITPTTTKAMLGTRKKTRSN